ncbi:MAG: DUF3450 domain-containing protein [Marinicaulis sp.]|nr:DUF3450 domain-containing protein [Marinicaulis sp.]NNE41984.1 DUF3450 domain-containing protein [Marinicaulis sp.]
MKRAGLLGSAALALAVMSAPAQAQFKSALDTSEQTARETAASQQRIDQLDDQTAALLNDYRANLKQLEAARRYNASLERNVEAQTREIERLTVDIENVEGLQRAMQPLMEDMVETFGQLVNADAPFLVEERAARAARLQGLMSDTSQSAAQKYRLIVEAYQIENEYGRTIGFYEGTIGDGESELTGEFLRVGRIALIFKTPDDSVLRIWDKDARDFVDLNRSYLQDVKFGLRMAKEQTAPDIFFVPVKPPAAAAQ